MSMYSEQDLYKFLERIAISLERLAASPVTGYPPSTQLATTPSKASKAPLAPHVVSVSGAKTESTSASPVPALKPPTDKLQ